MSALSASLRTDVLLQARNRLYSIGIAVALILAAVMWFYFDLAQTGPVLATLFLSAVGGTTYLFVAAAIIFEREQGTLTALAVTPLAPRHYLVSKVATLSGFAAIESLIVFIAAGGQRLPNPGWMFLGIIMLAVMLTLLGIAQALKARTFTEFVAPTAIAVMIPLQLPALEVFGLWSSPLLYLAPSRPAVVFMRASYESVALGEWLYACGYGASLLLLCGWLAHRRVKRGLHRQLSTTNEASP